MKHIAPANANRVTVVDLRRFELLTSSVQGKHAANCVTSPRNGDSGEARTRYLQRDKLAAQPVYPQNQKIENCTAELSSAGDVVAWLVRSRPTALINRSISLVTSFSATIDCQSFLFVRRP